MLFQDQQNCWSRRLRICPCVFFQIQSQIFFLILLDSLCEVWQTITFLMPRFYHKIHRGEHYWVFMGINLLEVNNPIRHVSRSVFLCCVFDMTLSALLCDLKGPSPEMTAMSDLIVVYSELTKWEIESMYKCRLASFEILSRRQLNVQNLNERWFYMLVCFRYLQWWTCYM